MGDLIKRTKYAKTLEKIAQHGADLFYTGKMAKQVRIFPLLQFIATRIALTPLCYVGLLVIHAQVRAAF